jgi:AcrR family transcriptional regulator
VRQNVLTSSICDPWTLRDMISGHPNGAAHMATEHRGPDRERIVDAALELAEESGWANVRLYRIAERVGVPLAAIQAEFRDQDALANAWFARALAAVGRIPPEALAGQPAPERLHLVMMRWFETLAPHREVTGDMLRAKLYPSHPQHWVPLIFDLSRLVHWFLDAARIASSGRSRQLAEVGLTVIVLASLRVWLSDCSPDSERTRSYLHRRFNAADRWLTRLT